MRKIIIAGNWKMHKTIGEAIELANNLKRLLNEIDSIDIVICPVYTSLSEVSDVVTNSNIKLGAQDMYWEKQGAFTGEVSGYMIKDTGALYVIIGHSERRIYFNETNQTVNKKVKAALESGLIPIMCVGEKLEEREKGITFDIVKSHVEEGLNGIPKEDAERIIIAYEPVWAIGTGKTATSAQAQEVHKYIRSLLVKLYDQDVASKIRIQYGGSVKPENTKELLMQSDIDGALVGGASLDANSFFQIVKNSIGVK
ncbi:MAG: triose-phosphate isomerase [Candidatus Omnitrophota bacterium]